MRPPSHFLAIAPLAACLAEPPATADDACPIAERVLLAAAPPDFVPAPDVYYDFYTVGDHILYTFDAPDDPQRTYWHKQRCGGEPEPFPSLLFGLQHPFSIDTPDGPVLYARTALGDTILVDRLDVPGADVPRPVQGLPSEAGNAFYKRGSRYASFSQLTRLADVRDAAGLDATTFAHYTHAGDPDVPAARVGLDIVQISPLDDRLLALDDDGTLRAFDPFTGASTTLLTGVRHYDLAPDRHTILWQAIGDDLAEPVYLRDLDGDTDVQVAVNEYAAESWGRGESDTIGDWTWTVGAAAMRGPDRSLVLAVRADTGAALPIPEHLRSTGSHDRYFALDLFAPDENLEALWDPLTGELREWYRGPHDPDLFAVEGDLVEYILPIDDTTRGLWRLDLATGERTELIAELPGTFGRFDDRRYLLGETTGSILLPPFPDFLASVSISDLSVLDLATGVRHPLADAVYARTFYPDEGFVYLDVYGPEPGVWAVPLPK